MRSGDLAARADERRAGARSLQLPSDAPLGDVQDHAVERQALAYEFRREQSQILNNSDDAQLRENAQRNNTADYRPLSDALRHIAKRIEYPIEQRQQRFDKYPIRRVKLTKSWSGHKKSRLRDSMKNQNVKELAIVHTEDNGN
jgi:hypothetical protein